MSPESSALRRQMEEEQPGLQNYKSPNKITKQDRSGRLGK